MQPSNVAGVHPRIPAAWYPHAFHRSLDPVALSPHRLVAAVVPAAIAVLAVIDPIYRKE